MDAKTFNPKEEFFSAESLPFGRLTVETNSKINYADPEAINFFYLPVKQLKMRILPIMEKLHEMVYLCNFDEQLIPEYISSGVKKLTGYSPADMIQDPGLLFGELIHPEDKKKVYSKISEAISAGNDFKIKYRIITAEGIEKYVINRGRIIKTNDITTAIEGIIEDITEEKILRDKLEHKLKIEKTFSNITANFIGLFNLDEAKEIIKVLKIDNAADIFLPND